MEEKIDQLISEMAELKRVVLKQNDRISQLEFGKGAEHQPAFIRERQAESGQPVQEKEKKVKKEKGSFETQVGIHYLGRIGMVAILLGAGFFLKYSFDNNWVGPLGRIIIGYGAGFLLLGIGEWFRRKYELWSRVFTGGGIVLFYFSTFSAQYFFDLINLPVTILLMSVVTIFAGILSLKYDTIIVALFALVGGFVTPLVIAGSLQDESFLRLGYVVLLNLAVLALSAVKKWHALDIVAFLATVYYMFDLHESISEAWSIGFLAVYFLMFFISSLIMLKTREEKKDFYSITKNHVIFYLIANAVFCWGFIMKFFENQDNLLGGIALGLALWYLVFMKVAQYIAKEKAFFCYTLLAIALAFVTIGIGMFLNKYWMAALWSILGAGVIWIGFYSKQYIIRVFGLAILLLSLVVSFSFVMFYFGASKYAQPIINESFFVSFVVLIALIAVYQIYKHYSQDIHKDEKFLLKNINIVANLFALFTVTKEIGNFVENDQVKNTAISVFWGVYAVALVGFGIVIKKQFLRILGILLFAVTVAKVLLVDLSDLDTIFRVAAFVIVGSLLLLASFLYQKSQK